MLTLKEYDILVFSRFFNNYVKVQINNINKIKQGMKLAY